MATRHLKTLALVAFIGLFVIGCAWWGVRKLDPTSGAEFISDSPDGKYRVAIFDHDGPFGGHPEYEAGLFEGRWPHQELKGARAAWNNDSLGSSDFGVTWRADGVAINYYNGRGDERSTIVAQVMNGTQRW
jgi:hypothetical protein